MMKHPEISGPVNLCSPNPVRNKDLAKALGKALHRPSFIPAPGFMIKLFWENSAQSSSKDRGSFQKAIGEWFVFQYADIHQALQTLRVNKLQYIKPNLQSNFLSSMQGKIIIQ